MTEMEDNAMASEPHTGSNLACPAGYTTPAAMGKATRLYMMAERKLNLTRRKIDPDRSIRVRTPERSEETKMKEAVEIATSLPDPMAMETSAEAKACLPVY
jgi:hypothetical protein